MAKDGNGMSYLLFLHTIHHLHQPSPLFISHLICTLKVITYISWSHVQASHSLPCIHDHKKSLIIITLLSTHSFTHSPTHSLITPSLILSSPPHSLTLSLIHHSSPYHSPIPRPPRSHSSPSLLPPSPHLIFSLSISSSLFSHIITGCSCDPAIYTDDCDQHFCAPFLGIFLFLEGVVLTCYVITILYVEIHSKKKSRLWRIILPSCCAGCLGMRSSRREWSGFERE